MLLFLEKWSHDIDLQIILADVRLEIEDSILIEEPLCIDVGLPALLLSAIEATTPNRWASSTEWQRMPFFVCGCGDAGCRGFSFIIEHVDDMHVKLSEVDERSENDYRVAGEYVISSVEYCQQVEGIGQQFLDFVRNLDYKPYFTDTVEVVQVLLNRIKQKLGLLERGNSFKL